jgi:hypothetical protein
MAPPVAECYGLPTMAARLTAREILDSVTTAG